MTIYLENKIWRQNKLSDKNFKAMIVTETEDKKHIREITEKSIDELPEGDVLIKVLYSSLSYKDALSAIGKKSLMNGNWII